MRARFIALAAAIWAIVVAAGILLFTSFGYCYLLSDPSLRNRLLCSTIGTSMYLDIILLVVGVPVLILIDHVARNPSWMEKPLTTRMMHLWLTLTVIIVLLFVSYLLPAGLFPLLLVIWLSIGLIWAMLFIGRAEIHRPPEKPSQLSTVILDRGSDHSEEEGIRTTPVPETSASPFHSGPNRY